MLDFLLSIKVNDKYLKDTKHKLNTREKFTKEELSYIDSTFQSEISRLRRITRSRFDRILF
jgi:hypothetical protein